jgi:hypothetical protein
MKQCHLSTIYLSWITYLGGLIYLVSTSNWIYAFLWLILVPVVQWLYVRKFPGLSTTLGYSRIVNDPRRVAVQRRREKSSSTLRSGAPSAP